MIFLLSCFFEMKRGVSGTSYLFLGLSNPNTLMQISINFSNLGILLNCKPSVKIVFSKYFVHKCFTKLLGKNTIVFTRKNLFQTLTVAQ